ncbi:MAG: helix-turn-helix domain-containing protein [Gammaproteobacteria bacterium]
MNEYEETKALLSVVVILFGLSIVGHGAPWGYLVAIAGTAWLAIICLPGIHKWWHGEQQKNIGRKPIKKRCTTPTAPSTLTPRPSTRRHQPNDHDGATGRSPRPKGLTVTEAARRLGIGRNQAYAGVKDGSIPSIRVGGRIIVPEPALNRLLSGETAA